MNNDNQKYYHKNSSNIIFDHSKIIIKQQKTTAKITCK